MPLPVGDKRITCPLRRCTREKYSASGSQMIKSSSVMRNAFVISRLAAKDFPLPGVPKISPLGVFKLLAVAEYHVVRQGILSHSRGLRPSEKSSCVIKGMKIAVLEVVSPRCIGIRFSPSGIEDISPASCW